MHLHNGDAGLRRLFFSLFSLLPPGGVVVIEPQEWENYKSAVKKNKDLRPTFQTLEMRPPFIEDMQKVGFKLESHIEREEGGFSRPLLVWRKE
jgi:7SK snRNA methylphosphate capping enzyme